MFFSGREIFVIRVGVVVSVGRSVVALVLGVVVVSSVAGLELVEDRAENISSNGLDTTGCCVECVPVCARGGGDEDTPIDVF